MRRCWCLLLIVCLPVLVFSKTRFHFSYSSAAKKAYESVLSFRFDEARSILDELKTNDPYNLVVHHIENYIDLFVIYSGEGGKSLKEFKRDKSNRLTQVKLGDPQSPYYLYVQAEIRLHSALVRWKYSDYVAAFQDITRAYKLLKKNHRLFPSFMANQKDLGLLHTIIGTIPSNYRWGIKLISGLNGTIDQGMGELEEVIRVAPGHDFVFERETQILYALLMFYIKNEKEEAWRLLNNYSLEPTQNVLHCYILANIAMLSGKNDTAIKILENRPQGDNYFPFRQLDFMLGVANLRRIDPTAGIHFEKYLRDFKGKILVKSAYQKLAWMALMKGNRTEYDSLMKQCLSQGNAKTEDDKQAQNEAELYLVPNPGLLKSRLLFDGGYYTKAYEVIKSLDQRKLEDKKDRLEFNYRQGRILQSLGKQQSAIKFYLKTIEDGASEPYYYACNAALQIGQIYEGQKNLEQAKIFFNRCLSIKPKEYKTSLHHQAKAGLKRLKN